MKLLKQIEKFLKGNTLLALIGVLVLLIAMRQFSMRKSSLIDTYTFEKKTQPAEDSEVESPYAPANAAPTAVTDLLPSDAPPAEGPSLLKAGAAIGMVSQCSKNPNLQIRAEPPNPRGLSPQSQSVIEPGPSTGLKHM